MVPPTWFRRTRRPSHTPPATSTRPCPARNCPAVGPSVLPGRPDAELGHEYLPEEEEVATGRFASLVANIRDGAVREAVDWAHLQCASGVCPVWEAGKARAPATHPGPVCVRHRDRPPASRQAGRRQAGSAGQF